jgi:short-subunit dehydrogenase
MPNTRPLALVTGASSGIGAEFCRELARRGCDLVLVARRAGRLSQLAAELARVYGVRTEALAADLTKDEELAVVERRVSEEENLEYLVNDAGFGTRGKFFETDRDSQDRMHRLHVLATLRLTHAALPGMIERGRGNIVNVSSVAAFWETPGNVSYSATKAWMNSFTEGLALELKAAGSPVKVQALCPGFTYTEFHDVMGVDRGLIPGPLWMPAEAVVGASLRGLERGLTIVVPGLAYKFLVLLSRLVPRRLKRALVSVYAWRTGRL